MGHIAMISIITKAWEGALCPEMDSDNFAGRHKKSLKSTEVVAGMYHSNVNLVVTSILQAQASPLAAVLICMYFSNKSCPYYEFLGENGVKFFFRLQLSFCKIVEKAWATRTNGINDFGKQYP